MPSPRAHRHVVGMLRFMSWHKPIELAHFFFYSVLVSISVFMALSTVFHSIHPPYNYLLLTLFFPSHLCLIGPFNHISLYESLHSPDIIPSGRLGLQHQLANLLIPPHTHTHTNHRRVVCDGGQVPCFIVGLWGIVPYNDKPSIKTATPFLWNYFEIK